MDQLSEHMDKLTIDIIAPIARIVLAHDQRLNKVDPAESTA